MSLGVEGAFDSKSAALEDVSVDHGGSYVFVPQQFLNSTDVVTILEEMGGETVSKGMARDAFSDGSLSSSFFYSPLQAG